MIFKRLNTKEEVNVVDHCMKYLIDNPEGKLYISTDSQFHHSLAKYATVVVLANGRGCQVLYQVEILEPVGTDFEEKNINRLRYEIELTSNITTHLKDELGVDSIHSVELDFNEDPYYASNKVFTEAVGWIRGLGVHVEYKTSNKDNRKMLATFAADKVCKSSRR